MAIRSVELSTDLEFRLPSADDPLVTSVGLSDSATNTVGPVGAAGSSACRRVGSDDRLTVFLAAADIVGLTGAAGSSARRHVGSDDRLAVLLAAALEFDGFPRRRR